ncbi:Aspartyl/asparaginy/proline hydroxylase [Trinorchestia longiramus]|nr:Aspartyl/asparaginy/proline hydroxylase [Trinorchestia longiramus]
MSGDLQVRKRKGKNKKKENEAGSERPTRGSKSQNGASSFIDSSPEYSDVPTFQHTEDYLDKSVKNGNKKKQQQSPCRSSTSSGSGCCAKILFIFLVTFLVILAALIFVQLHPREYATLVNKSQDSNIKQVAEDVLLEDTTGSDTPVKRALNIESIEEQIVREEEAEKVSFMKVTPRAVDVEIPDYDPDEKTPVQEPPIVKETAFVLGDREIDATEHTGESQHSRVQDSVDKEDERDQQLDSNNEKVIRETGEPKSEEPLANPEDSGERKRKNRKKSRKIPPSPEEILAHQNTLDRGERLMSAIRELSPNHPLLDELRPHLDGAKRDFQNLKLEGLESTTKHALIILEDFYVRLMDAKEKGELTTDHSRFYEEEEKEEEEEQPRASTVESAGGTSFDRPSLPPSSDSVTPSADSVTPSADSVTPSADTVTPSSDSVTPSSDSVPPSSDSVPPSSDSVPPSSDSVPPSSDSVPPSSDSSRADPKESAPRELSASRADVGLEDLTEEDLASPVDEGDLLHALRAAEALRQQDPRTALQEFTAVVRKKPLSARAQLGRARCLDALALAERSNARLEQAIASYRSVLDIAEEQPGLVSERLLRAATNTLIDKLRFRGHLPACVLAQLRLLEIFPDDSSLRNQLGITYLLQGKPAAAQKVFTEVLERWPHDGLAQVHLGFILKTTDGNNEDGARLMRKGIDSEEPGTGDARFYFHLGDALHRLGRQQEAGQVYEEAAAKGLILRPTQRSLYNVNRLSAKPVWAAEETTYETFFKKLKSNWETIRNEGLALIAAGFQPESENLRDSGKWGQLELYSRGRQNPTNCARAPKTCSIVGNFKPASGCRRGQVKFSLMEGGTHVWAHCGPTNCRLRAHLGLVVPKEEPVPVLRVDDQYLKWKEGEILVFDDSFEHEVWHNGTSPRLVLIVDLWHPELTLEERSTLAPV